MAMESLDRSVPRYEKCVVCVVSDDRVEEAVLFIRSFTLFNDSWPLLVGCHCSTAESLERRGLRFHHVPNILSNDFRGQDFVYMRDRGAGMTMTQARMSALGSALDTSRYAILVGCDMLCVGPWNWRDFNHEVYDAALTRNWYNSVDVRRWGTFNGDFVGCNRRFQQWFAQECAVDRGEYYDQAVLSIFGEAYTANDLHVHSLPAPYNLSYSFFHEGHTDSYTARRRLTALCAKGPTIFYGSEVVKNFQTHFHVTDWADINRAFVNVVASSTDDRHRELAEMIELRLTYH
jgi:hypothetical protein